MSLEIGNKNIVEVIHVQSNRDLEWRRFRTKVDKFKKFNENK